MTPRIPIEYVPVRRSGVLRRVAAALAAGVAVIGLTLLAAIGVARAAIWYGERDSTSERR
jgi:hypothetical protein